MLAHVCQCAYGVGVHLGVQVCGDQMGGVFFALFCDRLTHRNWSSLTLGVFFSLYPQRWDIRHVWESCLAIFSTGTEIGIKAEPSPQPSSSLCLLHLVIHTGDIPCLYFCVGLLYSLWVIGCRDVLS